jgi:hypothetical protein
VRADLEALGRQDVRLLAVGVVQQCDAAGAVRVVLDGGDLGGHAVLDALEVDEAVLTLVAATAVAGGLATVDVATTGLLGGREERLLGRRLRDLREIGGRLEATARGSWACGNEWP